MDEATDPYCLRPGEAAALLTGHPWRRFVAIGDSVAEGVGDLTEGYPPLPWADRVAAELRGYRPELRYLNLGKRDLLVAEVRATQLARALDFGPDLALVVAGANDALRAAYRPDTVDAELAGIIRPLRERGVEVLTMGLFDTGYAPMVPAKVRHLISGRMREFAARTAALAEAHGALHFSLFGHPAQTDPDIYSADGLHGNGRGHAICAAEAIRRLGVHLALAPPS